MMWTGAEVTAVIFRCNRFVIVFKYSLVLSDVIYCDFLSSFLLFLQQIITTHHGLIPGWVNQLQGRRITPERSKDNNCFNDSHWNKTKKREWRCVKYLRLHTPGDYWVVFTRLEHVGGVDGDTHGCVLQRGEAVAGGAKVQIGNSTRRWFNVKCVWGNYLLS